MLTYFTEKKKIFQFDYSNLYINLACLFVCLFVCIVKTAEPIGPKFFVGHHVTTGKVYEWLKFQIFVSIKIRSSLNFWKFWKSAKFFVKIRELFLFCFTMYTKRTCSQLIQKMGAKRPLRLVILKRNNHKLFNFSNVYSFGKIKTFPYNFWKCQFEYNFLRN